jgi:hypothetical protein
MSKLQGPSGRKTDAKHIQSLGSAIMALRAGKPTLKTYSCLATIVLSLRDKNHRLTKLNRLSSPSSAYGFWIPSLARDCTP